MAIEPIIEQVEVEYMGIRLSIKDETGAEVGRVYLYVMTNDLHKKPFGLMESLHVAEKMRGRGLGKLLTKKVIEEAKKLGCYKLIATSRHERHRVHDLYINLGFSNHGKEFRITF